MQSVVLLTDLELEYKMYLCRCCQIGIKNEGEKEDQLQLVCLVVTKVTIRQAGVKVARTIVVCLEKIKLAVDRRMRELYQSHHCEFIDL